jgi:hypothetical protein
MSILIKTIIFALASLVGLWMVFQGFAQQNGLMITGALLTFFASLLLLWSETKNI